MNSYEPLPGIPGLLDDPQLLLSDLPNLPDFHIAPLRNPAPSRYGFAPLPLEPLTKSSHDRRQNGRAKVRNAERQPLSPPHVKPSDVLSAREAKKPNLAISELVSDSHDQTQTLQLPSFVSLSVVEKSPPPLPSQPTRSKRPRLELEAEPARVDRNRVLPRPAKKDQQKARPVPLLPAMVTGLHEPPPSARLLPSISDARPDVDLTTSSSKMNVKDILTESRQALNRKLPETEVSLSNTAHTGFPKSIVQICASGEAVKPGKDTGSTASPLKAQEETKIRRTRRKWTSRETADLQAGVDKHGFGKWKQILADPQYNFDARTAVDLKDRYRVFSRDGYNNSDTLRSEVQSQNQSPNASEDRKSAAPTNRRKRQPWTSTEDEALLAGVAKYGFQWSAIHADSDHEWGHRRPTDLRDRIRTMFPEDYKNADFRPLAKERDEFDRTDPRRSDTEPDTVQRNWNYRRKEGQMEEHTSKRKLTKEHLGGSDVVTNKAVQMPQTPQTIDNVGFTLPSFAFNDDIAEWNNRLPPLVEWDEMEV